MMHRARSRAVATCLVLLFPALAGVSLVQAGTAQATADAGRADSGRTLTADEALIERLETTRTTVDYAPEDLVKVIDELREKHGLNVQISWSVLDAAGIRKDRRVELRLKDVPLSVLLDNIVREIDASGGTLLGWAVDRGVVIITNRAALDRQTLLRAYDVRDLIESGYAIRRFASTPSLGLATTGREWVGGDATPKVEGKGFGGGGGGGGGGGNIFGDEADDPTRMEKIESLVQLLMEQVDPESWLDNGGMIGSVSVRDGVLLVRQSLRNHTDVRALLDLLRSVRPEPLHVDVAIVRLAPQRAAAVRAAAEGFPVVAGSVADQLAFGANVEGVLFRSTVGTRNGEGAWISDVSQIDVVAAERATVAQQASATTPILGQVHSGLEIIALPLVEQNSDRAEIEVTMAWKPSAAIVLAHTEESAGSPLDRTKQRLRTVSSQTRCTLGDAILLSIPASPSDAGASIEYDDWLVIRVRRSR